MRTTEDIRMTQVISVVQEKGGAGKTTLLVGLASLMNSDGARVALIDTDAQQSLANWAKKSQSNIDWHYEESDERLVPVINSLKKSEKYDVIWIDTAGFKSAMSIYAINAASLVLIPTKANDADARGAIRTLSHVESVATSMDKKIDTRVIMMDVDKNTNITYAVLEALVGQGAPLLQSMCGHRTGFKEMTSTGSGPEGVAKTEVQSILAELQKSNLLDYYGVENG